MNNKIIIFLVIIFLVILGIILALIFSNNDNDKDYVNKSEIIDYFNQFGIL